MGTYQPQKWWPLEGVQKTNNMELLLPVNKNLYLQETKHIRIIFSLQNAIKYSNYTHYAHQNVNTQNHLYLNKVTT